MPRKLQPDDPAVLEFVLKRLRERTREEWLEIFRKDPDFDEAWVLPDPRVPAAEPEPDGNRRFGED